MSKSLTRIVTTKPAMSNSAAALKIPTVAPKRVITFTRALSRRTPQNTLLPTMEKTCGLFDSIEPTVSTESRLMSLYIDPLLSSTCSDSVVCSHQADKSDLDMESNVNIFDKLFDTLAHDIPITQSSSQTNSKKSFAQKLNEANLKINTKRMDSGENSFGTPINLDLDDLDLSKLLTPNIEACMQFIQSGASYTTEPVDQPLLTPIAGDQLLLSLDITDDDLQDIIQNSGIPPQNPILSESSDHLYTAPKRRISSTIDDEAFSVQSTDLESSLNSSELFSPRRKRQRTKGVYRAEDVTNEIDLANYLERRKKNNISSKISRANKKSYYAEMDAKSKALEDQNKKLEVKINKLEILNQMMKDYLKDAFVGNLK